MANTNRQLRGKIQKVMHVELSNNLPGAAVHSEERQQGYGVVRGEDGQEVFFVDSVVEDAPFADLHVGQPVDFEIEDGPLLRAAYVRVPRHEEQEDRCLEEKK